jgi:two-component system, NarL family, invasion response regulator UvrY
MIKVLLVDDHDLVRTGIRRLLEDRAGQTGIQVVGEASTGEQALDLVRAHQPDVVLMDVNMPGIGGLEATRRLTQSHKNLKVIVLTVHAQGPFPKRLLEAGATGYLTKGCGVEEMITAIRRVMRGERYVSSEIAQQLALSLLPGSKESPFDALSRREMQILLMITQGHKTQTISDKLNLSPKTVSTYKSRLHEKLAVHNDLELMRMAVQHGMLEKDFLE